MADNSNDPIDIRCAQITWDEQGLPVSSRFGDIYFSNASGLEESRYVFLAQNHLAQRWQRLAPEAGGEFTIGETGFGTGLNFLAAWELWCKLAPDNWRLHFISVEKYPLSQRDLSRALHLWPQLQPLAQQLLDAWPLATTEGFHRLHFNRSSRAGVTLTLIVNNADCGLSQLLRSPHPQFERPDRGVQAWFLDGFAPAKNPDMWSEKLFSTMAKLSDKNATVATFTAAGSVKRGLEAAGFAVKKVPGFGRKRDMIQAVARPLPSPPDSGQFDPGRGPVQHPTPWAVPRGKTGGGKKAHEKTAIVIGAGLAGCHSANNLAGRGWRVTLLERGETLAAAASGNPQGVLYAKLSSKREALSEFNLHSLLYAQHRYRRYFFLNANTTSRSARQQPDRLGAQCGVLQLSHTQTLAVQHRQLAAAYREFPEFVRYLESAPASRLAGIDCAHGGLFFPACGWLSPPLLCQRLVRCDNIKVVCNSDTETLEWDGRQWWVSDTRGLRHSAPVVVIATAFEALRFEQTRHLPLRSIRGQVSYLPATADSRRLQTVICAEGYIVPAANGMHCLGATFTNRDGDPSLRPADHAANLQSLDRAAPALGAGFSNIDINHLAGRTAFRCATPDYLPVVGPAPIHEAFLCDYAPLRKNARASIPVAGRYHPGLYLNLGHGSRGLAYTPLCAELLGAHVEGQLLPLPRSLATVLHPARFIIRDLIRGRQ